MHKATGVLVAIGAVSLLVAPPALADKDAVKEVDVLTDTTVVITPTGPTTATYSGKLSTRPTKKGKGKKEKTRRRNLAKDCLEGRTVTVWHGPALTGFRIGTATTDVGGNWSLTGNKAPTGDTITVQVDSVRKGKAFCAQTEKAVQSP